jgi:hypothetical protein
MEFPAKGFPETNLLNNARRSISISERSWRLRPASIIPSTLPKPLWLPPEASFESMESKNRLEHGANLENYFFSKIPNRLKRNL